MKILLKEYNAKKIKTFEDVIDLHQRFEVIHPFQDGNGRVGRLLMFKECLANGFVPFIITDELKMFYCRGTSVVAANQRISARYPERTVWLCMPYQRQKILRRKRSRPCSRAGRN